MHVADRILGRTAVAGPHGWQAVVLLSARRCTPQVKGANANVCCVLHACGRQRAHGPFVSVAAV